MTFPEGIRVYKPHDNAPEFVKANLVVNGEFIEWFKGNSSEGEVKLDLLESKNGKYYLSKNEFKPSDGSI